MKRDKKKNMKPNKPPKPRNQEEEIKRPIMINIKNRKIDKKRRKKKVKRRRRRSPNAP